MSTLYDITPRITEKLGVWPGDTPASREVLLDLNAMTEPYTDAGIDVVDTLLYRGKASHVDTVMIQGEVVVRDGTFIKMDKAEVLREIKEQFARPVEERALEAKKLAQGLKPFVEEFYKDWGKAETAPHYGYNSRV